jgi:NTP pyrophosphatase (non-canonical NTP hydrolase)
MTPEQRAILACAIKQYGEANQIDMLHEEMGELMQAINKFKRKCNLPALYPSQKDTVEYCKLYFDVCSEIADVKIMIEQLEFMFDYQAVQLSVDRKIERLKERLNKNV